jgi:hypothetical protein
MELKYIFIALLIIGLVSAKLTKENVVIAINCGGNSYTDEEGIKYEKVVCVNLG